MSRPTCKRSTAWGISSGGKSYETAAQPACPSAADVHVRSDGHIDDHRLSSTGHDGLRVPELYNQCQKHRAYKQSERGAFSQSGRSRTGYRGYAPGVSNWRYKAGAYSGTGDNKKRPGAYYSN